VSAAKVLCIALDEYRGFLYLRQGCRFDDFQACITLQGEGLKNGYFEVARVIAHTKKQGGNSALF